MIDFIRNVGFCLDVELGANRARAFAIVAGLAMATTGEMATPALRSIVSRTALRKTGRRSTSSP